MVKKMREETALAGAFKACGEKFVTCVCFRLEQRAVAEFAAAQEQAAFAARQVDYIYLGVLHHLPPFQGRKRSGEA